MQASQVRKSSAVAVCVVSGMFALYDGILASLGRVPAEHLFDLHGSLVSVLLATWFVADRVVQRRSCPSFDHGWFVLAVLPIYGPYHLISTRGWRGVAICAGMVALFILPWIAEVLVYYVR